MCRRWLVAAWALAIVGTVSALAELPSWIRNVESGSALDAIFFRLMSLPGGAVAFRRPPRETRPALGELIKSQGGNAELYSLRALEDEQQLDFAGAEADWKAYVSNSPDKINAQLTLADFYHRRLRPADEIKALSVVANSAPVAAEKLTPIDQQRSWLAFQRIFSLIQEQGLPREMSIAQYRAWIARYPQEASLYSRFLQFLVAQKEFDAAGQLVASYHQQFPSDQIFPVKARAMIEYRRASVREGLSVYEKSFEPLWDPDLVKNYFDLLRDTGNLRNFLDQARSSLNMHPEDLNAMARIFYYYQQQGKLEGAQAAVAEFRRNKEASKLPWTSEELYVCAHLLEDIHAYPEAARYYFALYNSKGASDAQEQAIAGLTDILLTAPEMPIRCGSGELSMYRDIATMDQGPGYLNGILSLILNTTEPAAEYSQEEQRAVAYFHRSRGAEMLALLDSKFPNSSRRPELHARLLEFYAASGESDAVIQGGKEFLANFANAPERTSIALLMADAYARKNDTANEFAIYDSVLRELAAKAGNVPLGVAVSGSDLSYRNSSVPQFTTNQDSETESESDEGESGEKSDQNESSRNQPSQAFQIASSQPQQTSAGPRSPEYARVLERYLARLGQMKQVPRAIGVLGAEIDRNPDDPGLYERLAVFLDQNRLGAEQEEVYRRAMARFPDRSWYDKLARFYLRYRRDSEFEQLTRDAIKSFSGTDLERYFQNVYGSPALYLRLNQYAHQRFPHNPVFVHNLLSAYQTTQTYSQAAWEALLRQHWVEESDLRDEFFEYLSRTGRLESELASLQQTAPDAASWLRNPAATDFLANANLWRSHFEESAPQLESLAEQFPAQREIVRTASAVYRSLAYFDPADTFVAAKMEDGLSQFDPRDTETLARIGDIYADREQFEHAAPYWERILHVAPGQPSGYLEAATIYWDYYDFGNALRLLHEGRDHLHNSNLYSYEAGAIYENQRDYAHAIDEYLKGALETPGSSAETRLLQLARRPKLRDLIDQATAKTVTMPSPPMPAVYLRVKVLEAENRKPEMEPLLEGIVRNSTSLEQVGEIQTMAEQKSLEGVRQLALERQIALTTDPVNRLQLRYSLAQLYEARKDFQSAATSIEALYRENPRVLGVVRSTVDFYWRTKSYSQAIAVLLQAAKDANADYKRQFTYEAARKATEAKQYQQTRELLAGLLQNDPYNSEYLAAMADAYARAGDDRGLQQFYEDKITTFHNAALPPDVRKSQIASLRRGLIPALTRSKEYAGAVDQYIELINNFPEDDALATEAALYAQRYQQQSQLVGFYEKTVTQSPRDFRWAMVLARIQTNLEDYPAAIETYGKAIKIRPDRSDLFIARAGLEERLMRFDDAAADYQHIYELNYRDPQWMEKLAETRARQGKTSDAVAALKVALIDGRPENPLNDFEVARRLETWGMLPEAGSFAEQGTKSAGDALLADPQFLNGAKTYVRIMTRLRRHDVAYARMEKAVADASSSVGVLEQQVARQGVLAISDQRWRERFLHVRIENSHNGMAAVLEEMGNAINTYFTPEERLTFATFAETKRSAMGISEVERYAIPLAQTAGLADQEARWRFEAMMQRPRSFQDYHVTQMQGLVDLQRRRGKFAELGTQLDQFAATLPVSPYNWRTAPLLAASDAYRSAGDQNNELRDLNEVSRGTGNLDGLHQRRLFELLLARQPDELVRIASNWTSSGQTAADFVIAHGDAALSHRVVAARSQARPAVWNKSYDALVGLYFTERTPEVNRAFLDALGGGTIAQRLSSQQLDRAQQLAGTIWFYYGSRYGEYLGATKLGDPEAYLPATVEESPATAANYLTLANYYDGSGDTRRAIDDYQHTLDLAGMRPDVHEDLAVAYYKQGDHAAAVAEWKQAFAALSKELDSASVPETFWSDFGRTCDQLRTRHLFAELRPDAEAILRTYLRRNGNWRSNVLLMPAYLAIGDSASATAWLLELASSAQDPAQILADVVDAKWIPIAQREPIYRRILQEKSATLAKVEGTERESAADELGTWQVRWIQYLVNTKRYAEAADAIADLPKQTRDSQAASLIVLELRVAAQLGTLDSRIQAYRAGSIDVPSSDLLRSAAQKLFESGDKKSARQILEFVFAREIDNHQLVASNFLGLAEIRIAVGDVPGALDLLHRLVVVVGNPFDNLDPAASLLEKTGHNQEAIEFLNQLVKSAPWNPSYRLRLAKAKLATGQASDAVEGLTSIAASSENSYELRGQAASTLGGRTHSDLGSAELNLLGGNSAALMPGLADKFYYYAARIRAAQNSTDPAMKLQLLSHCAIDFPRRDEARVPLFKAAVGQKSDEFALGIIEPLFSTQFLRPGEAPSAEEQIESPDDREADEEADSSTQMVMTTTLSRADRALVAQMIGDSMLRLNRTQDALHYFELARQTGEKTTLRKTLRKEIADLRTLLRIDNQNAGRQPILHEALEQDRIVRPKLLARTGSGPEPVTPKGGAQ